MSREKQIDDMDLAVLSCYRNKYYSDGNSTEQGIIANAINDILPAIIGLRSEVEQLQRKYDLAVAEREANVKGFAEELEKANVEIETLKDNNEHLAVMLEEAKETIAKNAQQALEVTLEEIKKSKQEIAREIFEEIESLLATYTCEDNYGEYISTGLADEFSELKKKYTEDKKDEDL